MRSPGSASIVCRRRSGELVVRERPMAHVAEGWRKLPLLRGVVTVVESLRLGSSALRWSAELFEQDMRKEEEEERENAGHDEGNPPPLGPPPGLMSALALTVVALATQDAESREGPSPAVGLGAEAPIVAAPVGESEKKGSSLLAMLPILFAIALFVALPQAGAEGINKLFSLSLEVTSPAYQMITGVAKLVIIVGYLLLFRRMPEVRRVFQYHGAEHKTISTYEAGEDLVVENARPKTTAHPRCGTTFLVMVALVSVIIFSVAGAFFPRVPGGRVAVSVSFFLMKLPFLPLVAAVTEPDDAQLEVALASLRATLWREAAHEAPAPSDRTFSGYGELVADPGYARA
jgi:uncharacterized protein YqhQ